MVYLVTAIVVGIVTSKLVEIPVLRATFPGSPASGSSQSCGHNPNWVDVGGPSATPLDEKTARRNPRSGRGGCAQGEGGSAQ